MKKNTRKNIIYFLVGFFFALTAHNAYADAGYVGSGSNDSAFNSQFCVSVNSPVNGYNEYVNETYDRFVFVRDDLALQGGYDNEDFTGNTSVRQFYRAGANSDDLTGSWLDDPISFTGNTDCPFPATSTPPLPALGGATSTLEQTQTNLFFGWVIFFATMCYVVWFFRKRQ